MSTTDSKITRALVGRVVSDKMNKTRTVLIERQIQHSVYGKYLRRSTKVHAHDEGNTSREGDYVRITECRPLSKTKSWTIAEIVTKNV